MAAPSWGKQTDRDELRVRISERKHISSADLYSTCYNGILVPVSLKEVVSATPLLLFTSGNDKLNCLKEAPKIYLVTKRNS